MALFHTYYLCGRDFRGISAAPTSQLFVQIYPVVPPFDCLSLKRNAVFHEQQGSYPGIRFSVAHRRISEQVRIEVQVPKYSDRFWRRHLVGRRKLSLDRVESNTGLVHFCADATHRKMRFAP